MASKKLAPQNSWLFTFWQLFVYIFQLFVYIWQLFVYFLTAVCLHISTVCLHISAICLHFGSCLFTFWQLFVYIFQLFVYIYGYFDTLDAIVILGTFCSKIDLPLLENNEIQAGQGFYGAVTNFLVIGGFAAFAFVVQYVIQSLTVTDWKNQRKSQNYCEIFMSAFFIQGVPSSFDSGFSKKNCEIFWKFELFLFRI